MAGTATDQISVIDRDVDFLQKSQEWFQTRGCECYGVLSPEAASAVLESQRYNILVAEVDMPGVVNVVRTAQLQTSAPALIATARGLNQRLAVDLTELGPVDLLMKPVDFPELGRAVRQASTRRVLQSSVSVFEEQLASLVRELEKVQHGAPTPSTHNMESRSTPTRAETDQPLADAAESLIALRATLDTLLGASSSVAPLSLSAFNDRSDLPLRQALTEAVDLLQEARIALGMKVPDLLEEKLQAVLSTQEPAISIGSEQVQAIHHSPAGDAWVQSLTQLAARKAFDPRMHALGS
jgi:DNA-binding response OmpR family regulator